MTWQTLLTYAVIGIAAIAALKIAFNLTLQAWFGIGLVASVLVIGLQIAPSILAGERSLAQLRNSQSDSDEKTIDKHRENVRRDILARATTFSVYPYHVLKINEFVRSRA